jgi:hypothetical protein
VGLAVDIGTVALDYSDIGTKIAGGLGLAAEASGEGEEAVAEDAALDEYIAGLSLAEGEDPVAKAMIKMIDGLVDSDFADVTLSAELIESSLNEFAEKLANTLKWMDSNEDMAALVEGADAAGKAMLGGGLLMKQFYS